MIDREFFIFLEVSYNAYEYVLKGM